MIEVRTFDGDSAELSRFLLHCWGSDYAGRMPFPHWTPEYLEWQLSFAHEHRECLVAAYDGARLAATIVGLPFQFADRETHDGGILSSWLSVAPDLRRQGLVPRLLETRARRLAALRRPITVSFRYFGSPHSLAKLPVGRRSALHAPVGFWIRSLDPARIARWTLSPLERLTSRWLGPLQPPPPRPQTTLEIRPYRSADLASCLSLVQSRTVDFRIDWDTESLRLQLEGTIPRTLVAAEQGQPRGFVNYHLLPFVARGEEPLGVIDLIVVDQLRSADQSALLAAALWDMKDRGAMLALKLRTGDYPRAPLLRTGFIPRRADSFLLLQPAGPTALMLERGRHSILWR